LGGHTTKWAAGETRMVSLTVNGTVPRDATAVVANITTTGSTGSGFLQAWGYGAPQPGTSILNFNVGADQASTTTIMLGTCGFANISSSGNTDIIIDIFGYFGGTPGTGVRLGTLASPTRICDTRGGLCGGPLAAGAPRLVQVAGANGVPSNAAAVVLNVTATGASGAGFFAIDDSGSAQTSILNFSANADVPNLAISKLNSSGQAFITTSTTKHVIVDVVGWFSSTNTLNYFPIEPVRLASAASTGPGATLAVASRNVGSGASYIPSSAQAVFSNHTANVLSGSAFTFLTVYPGGTALPNTSNVNVPNSAAYSNHAVARIGTNNAVNTTNAFGTVAIFYDVEGYFA
jgi:hypothetical protein